MISSDWRAVPGGYQVGDGRVERVLIPGIAGEVREFSRLTMYRGSGAVRILTLPDTETLSLRALASLVEPYLPDHPVVVVGASFGGLIGRALPPDRVLRLVTVGMLPTRTAAATRAGHIGRLVPLLPAPLYEAWYGRRSASAWAEDGADPALVASVRLPSARVLGARLRAIAAWGLADRPAVPTTMLWGSTDAFATWNVAGVEALGARAVVVPGGHRPHLSHPAEVAQWW